MNQNLNNIPAEKFRFASRTDLYHDSKFATKPVSYFQGAFKRFSKNKGAVVGGIVIAIALVLPGISVSQMLLVLGVYEKLTAAVDALDIMTLLSFAPLVIGTVGGILLTTNLIERAMKKYPTATYLIVFGFILGSLPELFPVQMLTGWNILFAPLLAVLGFFVVFMISKKENA